jgi:hypothetical protein
VTAAVALGGGGISPDTRAQQQQPNRTPPRSTWEADFFFFFLLPSATTSGGTPTTSMTAAIERNTKSCHRRHRANTHPTPVTSPHKPSPPPPHQLLGASAHFLVSVPDGVLDGFTRGAGRGSRPWQHARGLGTPVHAHGPKTKRRISSDLQRAGERGCRALFFVQDRTT